MNAREKNWPVLLLSLMIFMAPAMGSPTEELLQDTLKSILISLFALTAGLAFFWQARKQNITMHFHGLLWLPLGLMTYALGSMTWSHAYLGGVEAIRWFVLSLILFLGMNTFHLQRVTRLAWGIHLGAVIASLWAALQFWDNFGFFAQGPAPASTFVNRNFFGEFLVCTLPFSVLLLSRVKDKASVFLLTFSLGFNIAALMMTGTRSALIGLMLLVMVLPVIVFLYRKQFESIGWRIGHCLALVMLLICCVMGIGSINTVNPGLIAESGHGDALDRAFMRTRSIASADEYSHGSFSIRTVMWKATGRMILANPVVGVGAGAWEVQVPLYQEAGSQLETDYYAHNEILQLAAEYGIVGWLFLLGLAAYLLWAAHRTWTDRSPQGEREALLRALTLASLLVFLLVSNAGFPLRMASTGALFALSLAILAASDIRLDAGKYFLLKSVQLKACYSWWALSATALCAAFAVHIAQQAIVCESKLVRAVKIALTISQSGTQNDPGWDDAKAEMLQLVREGVTINPHYRKLTPMVADAMASWGDWKNATWVWESIIDSRPYVVAMLANAARGHMQTGDLSKAQDYLNRARNLQPTAPGLASLEVMLWSRTGKNQETVLRAKGLLRTGAFDYDLVKMSYFLGMQNRNPELAILALELLIKNRPNHAVDGWLKLGHIYAASESRNEERAIQSYRSALAAADPQHQAAVLAMIPANYQAIAKATPRTH